MQNATKQEEDAVTFLRAWDETKQIVNTSKRGIMKEAPEYDTYWRKILILQNCKQRHKFTGQNAPQLMSNYTQLCLYPIPVE